MSSASEPAALPLCPNIWPSWGGNVILTLPTRSNFAECSWLARCAAAANACAGVSGLASGEAHAARATIVSRLARRRLIRLVEDLGGAAPFPSSPGTARRGDQRIDRAADPRLFESLRQFGVTGADGVGDHAQPVARLERGQHLEHIGNRDDRHLPEVLTGLLDDQGVAGIEEDAAKGHQ